MGAVPRVVDWNEDNKKDLILGEYDGRIRIYLNRGTDQNPSFNGFTYLKVNAANFDCGSYSNPHIMDWNNDGKKDVICGESGGKVWLMLNTGTNANPVFASSAYIQNGSNALDVGSRSSPTVADWNHDGKKDLLVGEQNGHIHFVKNVGTDAAPAFSGFYKLKIGSADLDAGYTVRIDLVDWDNDNELDIISGEYNGTVTYFHSRGALSLSHNQISGSVGGSIDLSLNASADNQGRNYLILGSVTGTEPGFPLTPDVTWPINWDIFTNIALNLLNTPIFKDFAGVLNSAGKATAVFNTMGPAPTAIGLNISFAYALDNPWDYASNGVNIEITP